MGNSQAQAASGIASVGLDLVRTEGLRWSRGSLLLAPLPLAPLLLRPFVPTPYQRHCFVAESSKPQVLFKDCPIIVAKKPSA